MLDRPILYSLSPGTSVTPTMAKDVSRLANMYRITGDDWDKWEDVAAHFGVTRWIKFLIQTNSLEFRLHSVFSFFHSTFSIFFTLFDVSLVLLFQRLCYC